MQNKGREKKSKDLKEFPRFGKSSEVLSDR